MKLQHIGEKGTSEITCIQISLKTFMDNLINYEALKGNGPFRTLMEVSKNKQCNLP